MFLQCMLILYSCFAFMSIAFATVLQSNLRFMKGAQIMYQIFARLMEDKGITPYRVSKETGVSQSVLSDWKRGRCVPKIDKLQKIADYFNVTIDYLMGVDRPGKEKIPDNQPEISGVYLSFAKDAQDKGIDPDDIRLAIETIERLKKRK